MQARPIHKVESLPNTDQKEEPGDGALFIAGAPWKFPAEIFHFRHVLTVVDMDRLAVCMSQGHAICLKRVQLTQTTAVSPGVRRCTAAGSQRDATRTSPEFRLLSALNLTLSLPEASLPHSALCLSVFPFPSPGFPAKETFTVADPPS